MVKKTKRIKQYTRKKRYSKRYSRRNSKNNPNKIKIKTKKKNKNKNKNKNFLMKGGAKKEKTRKKEEKAAEKARVRAEKAAEKARVRAEKAAEKAGEKRKREEEKAEEKSCRRVVKSRKMVIDLKPLLTDAPHNESNPWYGNTMNIDEFLMFKSDPSQPPKVYLDNIKEIFIAAFTNFYRNSIYKLINIIDEYLGNLADAVVGGGDGVNILLDPKDRLISPDIDIKIIIKHPSVNTKKWVNIYRLVVIMTEYIVDYIVCCLNGSDLSNFKNHMLPPIPNDEKFKPGFIRNLFYEIEGGAATAKRQKRPVDEGGQTKYNFHILDNDYFKTKLNHNDNSDFTSIGKPWNRRTSNMKAGGKEDPLTLMNVKLIAIDLRFNGQSYFSTISGALDIVVGVPEHLGHFNMLNEDMTSKGYCPCRDNIFSGNIFINSITMNYYIYEMIKMIKYGLRTRTGKIVKDLGRLHTLIRIGIIVMGMIKIPELESIVLMTSKHKAFPSHLKKQLFAIMDSIKETEVDPTIIQDIQISIDEIIRSIETNNLWEKIRQHIPVLNTQTYSKEDEFDDVALRHIYPWGDGDGNGDGPGNFSPFYVRIHSESDDEYDDEIDIDKSDSETSSESDSESDYESDIDIDKSDSETSDSDEFMKGGGWQDENTDSFGKSLESLNLYDFFGKKQVINITSITRCCVYSITLIENDKIFLDGVNYKDINSNYKDRDLNSSRIDYEKLLDKKPLNKNYLPSTDFDILCREPYMLYSYDNKNMDVTYSNKETSTFNTRRIFTNPVNAVIAAEVLNTITKQLIEIGFDEIKKLAQFRYVVNQDQITPNPDLSDTFAFSINETQLHAMFLFSSVIKGLNPIKLLDKKCPRSEFDAENRAQFVFVDKNKKPDIITIREALEIEERTHYDNNEILEHILKTESASNDNPYKFLMRTLVIFYKTIANIAEITDYSQIFL